MIGIGIGISKGNGYLTPFRTRVSETQPRVEGKALYSGTVRYVSSTGNNSNTGLDPALPKLTIGSAYTASSHGDIIQLLSNMDMAAESGGQLLLNTADKGVLIRGAVGDRSLITITQTNASCLYSIRLGLSNLMQFQSITFDHALIRPHISCLSANVGASNKAWFKFKDCHFTGSNTSATSGFVFNPNANSVSDTADKFYEWDGCTFNLTNVSGTFKPIMNSFTSLTTQFLFTDCDWTTSGFITWYLEDNSKARCAIYDSNYNQSYGQLCVAFGANTALPDNTGMIVDLRNNTITIANGFAPHGIMLGRGTNSVYCVNNNVTIPTTSDPVAIGFVIKTIASNVGDAYFAGNYANAPEPCLFKGCQKVQFEYNSMLSNYSTGSGLVVYNTVEADAPTGIPCTLNSVNHNNFIGTYAGIYVSTTTATEKGATSMQGWTIDNNFYYGTNDLYLFNQQNSTLYYLSNRSAFWNSTQEQYSQMVETREIYNP